MKRYAYAAAARAATTLRIARALDKQLRPYEARSRILVRERDRR